MQCRDCGADSPADSVYCHKCGARLDQQAEAGGDGATHPLDPPGESAGEKRASPADLAAGRLNRPSGRDAGDDSEGEMWVGGYSSLAMVGAWVLTGLASVAAVTAVALFFSNSTTWTVLLVALALVWIGEYLLYLYRRLSVKYRLTNHRFFHEEGILRRTTDRIEVIDMDDITYDQGLIERMVGVGTIKITSSDRTHPELLLRGIADVKEVAERLDSARRAERMSRGLHIEAI